MFMNSRIIPCVRLSAWMKSHTSYWETQGSLSQWNPAVTGKLTQSIYEMALAVY